MRKFAAWMMAGVLLGMSAGQARAHEDEGGHRQGVWFEAPDDGATVARTFEVKMKVAGMKIRKAGDLVPGAGHFHIIVDGGCVKQGEVVAKDAAHLHFGKGQEETTLTLSPGEHALSLQLADGHHVSYGKAWCRTIHVRVK
jgi:hypothetical protein